MTEIDELRKKIEVITIEMLSLLKTRTEIAQEIGKIKNQQGMSAVSYTHLTLPTKA